MITVPLRVTATVLVLVSQSNRFFLMVAIDVIDGLTGKGLAGRQAKAQRGGDWGPTLPCPQPAVNIGDYFSRR